jgi:hypothetical protein
MKVIGFSQVSAVVEQLEGCVGAIGDGYQLSAPDTSASPKGAAARPIG